MGAIMTKLDKEDKKQEEWRKIITNKITKDSGQTFLFEELHVLRGGKGRVCVCPSLIWPDNYSLIVEPSCLASYLKKVVTADVVVIWNLNSRTLTRDVEKQPEKTYGTDYTEVVPHLLQALVEAQLGPIVINFQDCDFSKVSEGLFKDFLYSQLGRLDEISFQGCEGMPVSEAMYEKAAEDAVTRKISVKSVQGLKIEEPDEPQEEHL